MTILKACINLYCICSGREIRNRDRPVKVTKYIGRYSVIGAAIDFGVTAYYNFVLIFNASIVDMKINGWSCRGWICAKKVGRCYQINLKIISGINGTDVTIIDVENVYGFMSWLYSH